MANKIPLKQLRSEQRRKRAAAAAGLGKGAKSPIGLSSANLGRDYRTRVAVLEARPHDHHRGPRRSYFPGGSIRDPES
jgi:hypothetical protein